MTAPVCGTYNLTQHTTVGENPHLFMKDFIGPIEEHIPKSIIYSIQLKSIVQNTFNSSQADQAKRVNIHAHAYLMYDIFTVSTVHVQLIDAMGRIQFYSK